MIKIELTGFNTRAEAEAFAEWYDAIGEDAATYWFEERKLEGLITVNSMICKDYEWDEDTLKVKLVMD